MPSVSFEERLQPSLFDRLLDDKPNEKNERRQERVIYSAQQKASVIRDLEYLLNATAHWRVEALLGYDEVAQSTLNYGIIDLIGVGVANVDVVLLQTSIRNAITVFEPRIDSDTLQVRVLVDANKAHTCTIALQIEATVWAHPMPLVLYLRTDLDLESGRCVIYDNE